MATKSTPRKPAKQTFVPTTNVTARPKRQPAPAKSSPRTRRAPTPPLPVAPSPAASTKQSQLIALLTAPPGATIEQMTTLTGWQPHTVRGTISGVQRKRLGLNVLCAGPADGPKLYRIVAA